MYIVTTCWGQNFQRSGLVSAVWPSLLPLSCFLPPLSTPLPGPSLHHFKVHYGGFLFKNSWNTLNSKKKFLSQPFNLYPRHIQTLPHALPLPPEIRVSRVTHSAILHPHGPHPTGISGRSQNWLPPQSGTISSSDIYLTIIRKQTQVLVIGYKAL